MSVATVPAHAHPRAPWLVPVLKRIGALAGVAFTFAVTYGAVPFRPHTASLRRLADMPLSVLGTGSIDFAAFHWAHSWGWLVTGLSLWLLEHLIADPE